MRPNDADSCRAERLAGRYQRQARRGYCGMPSSGTGTGIPVRHVAGILRRTRHFARIYAGRAGAWIAEGGWEMSGLRESFVARFNEADAAAIEAAANGHK